MPDITTALVGLTYRVMVCRLIHMIEEDRLPPLIEIKGLGAAVQAAKQGIASVRQETAGLSTDASALVAAIQDVRKQISQAQSDLQFEAETLGNGSGSTPSATSETSSAAKPVNPTISPETHTRDSFGNVIAR